MGRRAASRDPDLVIAAILAVVAALFGVLAIATTAAQAWRAVQ